MYFVFNVFIGFGVVATRKFQKGEFLLEYVGERINGNEAKIKIYIEPNLVLDTYRYSEESVLRIFSIPKFQWSEVSLIRRFIGANITFAIFLFYEFLLNVNT